LLIGKMNDGFDIFVMSKIQGTVESYTAKYHAAEKEVVQIMAEELEDAQEDLGKFNKIHHE
jgi:hypothetical protein